ncbi:gluconokinase [Nocardia sp. NPDC050712]|uniref:gluconokinase n=1 Tax=Nocardia sp. NPDC050712 TaxID=3155518 RepID=UPI00340AE2C5
MSSAGPRPRIVVVMGVSGSGKSTVASTLATDLAWPMLEGDELHPPANVAKMAAGHPLTDADRWPWLETIAQWIARRVEDGGSAVIACSALKGSYRDVLRQGVAGHPEATLTFIYLRATHEELRRRVTTRHHKYMPASLLDSQLATLEDPTGETDVVTIDVERPPHEVAAAARAAIG